jgi:EAL domain-containing protein (putative c-di-GMP-specific phosphodiesterase class I)
MGNNKKVIDSFKNWLAKQIRVEQPQITTSQFKEQLINLCPVFNTKTLLFEGVICDDLYTVSDENIYVKKFSDALENIAYWYCHGRAILTILPLPIHFLASHQLMRRIETQLMGSQLPVGLIRILLLDTKDNDVSEFKLQLTQLQLLGLILEIHQFSGSESEFHNLHTGLFQGVHLSTKMIRAAMKTTHSRELFNDLMIICKERKYHVYAEGISLVHDFNFVKERGVDFCYGPLMMPSVSKHQLLNITMSHFNHFINNTPKKKMPYGD